MARNLSESSHRLMRAHSAGAQCAISPPSGSHATAGAPNFALQPTAYGGV